MKLSRPHLAAAVVGIAALSVAAWWWQRGDAAPASRPSSSSSKAPAATAAATDSAPQAVEVRLAQALRIVDDAQAVGSLRARQAVMLRPEAAGRIVKLGFRDGERVRRGQLLVQLDDQLTQAQLRQAQAQATIAQTNLRRQRDLQAQGFVSASAVDQMAAALEVAQAQVALARAQVARMRITAPFDGVAGIRSVDLGDYVKDGADLVAVEDIARMNVDFRLPERIAQRVRVGQGVRLQLDALPQQPLEARVEAMNSLVDAEGRSVLVRASLDNAEGRLRGGMFARVQLVFGERDGVVVPEEALVPQGNRQFLVKVQPAPDGQGLQSQPIEARLGARLPGKVEVLEGLAPGDRVVTAGHSRLLGAPQRVRLVDIGAPAAAASAAGAAAMPAAGASAPGAAASGSLAPAAALGTRGPA